MRQCRRAGPSAGYCECCQDKYTDLSKVCRHHRSKEGRGCLLFLLLLLLACVCVCVCVWCGGG
jgi:hypothetical protein